MHVPFRGGPEALTEVMTGRVDFTSMGMSAALPLIKDGKLVALAVSTPKRSRTLPDVPTTIEAGLPDSDYVYWMGLFVPARTPRGDHRAAALGNREGVEESQRGGKVRARKASSRCRCRPPNSTL